MVACMVSDWQNSCGSTESTWLLHAKWIWANSLWKNCSDYLLKNVLIYHWHRSTFFNDYSGYKDE